MSPVSGPGAGAAARKLFVGHDVGTSGTKSILVDAGGEILADATAVHADGEATEQDPEVWLRAAGSNTRELLRLAGVSKTRVAGLAFAGQMLTLVPQDGAGRETRKAIGWMDDRGEGEARRIVRRMGGERVVRLLAGASPSGKDLVAKVAWLARNEPEVFARTRAFGDATSWLVARTTGKLGLDPTAASATGLLDLGTRRWARSLAWLAQFPLEKMAPLTPSDVAAGGLDDVGAEALGLEKGTPVATGLADIPATALGTGAVRAGEAHVYLGTSAWIVRATARPEPVPRAGVAAIPSGARSGCLAVGECESAGAARAWAAKMLGVAVDGSFDALAEDSPPGARGVVFAPWLFGERSPFPDAQVRGSFANLSLSHQRSDLARAVLEGVALNLRGVLEAVDPRRQVATLRAAGGGAVSDVWLQILADVSDRTIERVRLPRHAGARGAASIAAVAAGAAPSVEALAPLVSVERRFTPRRGLGPIYDARMQALRSLHAPLARVAGLVRSARA